MDIAAALLAIRDDIQFSRRAGVICYTIVGAIEVFHCLAFPYILVGVSQQQAMPIICPPFLSLSASSTLSPVRQILGNRNPYDRAIRHLSSMKSVTNTSALDPCRRHHQAQRSEPKGRQLDRYWGLQVHSNQQRQSCHTFHRCKQYLPC